MSADLVKANAMPDIAKDRLKQFWQKNSKQIAAVTAGGDVERVMRVTYSLLYRTPKLLECTPFSLLNGIVLAHQMGLVFGTQEVALVPFGREATLIVQYQGKVKLALASKLITSVEAEVVMRGEKFTYKRTQGGLLFEHEPDWETRTEAPSESNIIGAYCQLGTAGGGMQTKFVPIVEILNTRNRSRGYQYQLSKKGTDNPWFTDFGAMATKTAVHRAMKMAPQDARMGLANTIDDAEATDQPTPIAEGLDPSAFAPADTEEPLLLTGKEAQQQVMEEKLAALKGGKQ